MRLNVWLKCGFVLTTFCKVIINQKEQGDGDG
jgi:hypothetical protein